MLCPIVNTGRREGEAAVPCVKENCAWWIQGEKRAGSCTIPRLAHYLAGLLKTQTKIPESLDSLTCAVRDLIAEIQKAGER